MTHQREVKRQYGGSQPHISSYFPQQPQPQSLSQPSYSIASPEDSSTTPSLPHDIQSNLITVGMRVRKSVPEGYKTASEYSAFKLFSNTSKSAPATPTMPSPPSAQKTRPRANAGARELQPFCGLLKVGGLNTQQAWGIYSPTQETRSWSKYDCHAVDMDDMTPDEEDVPVLSQGSMNSGGATPKKNKRRCEWDDSGDDAEDSAEENNVFRVPFLKEERPIAVPRGRKGEKTVPQNRVFGMDMDFGEAEFLDFGASGMEVEMGGV